MVERIISVENQMSSTSSWPNIRKLHYKVCELSSTSSELLNKKFNATNCKYNESYAVNESSSTSSIQKETVINDDLPNCSNEIGIESLNIEI